MIIGIRNVKQSTVVVAIKSYDAQRALENLNRVTGLEFDSYPESLASKHKPTGLAKARNSAASELGDFLLYGLNK